MTTITNAEILQQYKTKFYLIVCSTDNGFRFDH